GILQVTALHVLDELMKRCGVDASVRNDDYTGEELPEIIDAVNLYDVMQEKWMFHDLGSCGEMLVLREARIKERAPTAWRDISAFRMEDDSPRVRPARLATECPQRGDPVWLAARVSHARRTIRATVVDKTERSFVFRYE